MVSNQLNAGQQRLEKGRYASAALFFIAGFMTGNWAPVVPEFKANLGLDSAQLGLFLFLFGLGALSAMPLVGRWVSSSGSRIPSLSLAIPTCLMLVALVNVDVPWIAALLMISVGASLGGLDVAMNANTAMVEAKIGRTIMSSAHGFWSLGALIGASLGGAMIEQFGLSGQAFIVSLVSLIILALSWRFVIGEDDLGAKGADDKLDKPTGKRLNFMVILIGVMALFSLSPEGSVMDWGALFLRQDHGVSVVWSGFAFAALSISMMILRFSGDYLRRIFGEYRVWQFSCLFSIVGLLVAGIAPSPSVAILGFFLAGFGLANLAPLAFSAANRIPDIAPGISISIVAAFGYSGILFMPSIIGLAVEHISFGTIFCLLAMMPLCIFGFLFFMRDV